MSTIVWSGNQLLQAVGNRQEQLGKVDWEESSNSWVLWLKDTCRVLGHEGGHIRGDEFASSEEAREKAASSPSAFIMHWIWMRNAIKEEVANELEKNRANISSKLGGQVKWKTVRNKVAEYFESIPRDEIRKWGKKIAEGVLLSELIDQIRQILG